MLLGNGDGMGQAETDKFLSWSATHAGTKRGANEDALVDRPEIGLWAVADGAGGHTAGALASGMLADTLAEVTDGLAMDALIVDIRARVQAAHDAMGSEATSRGQGVMVASTLVVLVARGPLYTCLWAGDSRAYLLRGDALTQITRDHSLVQTLVDAGAITAEEAVNHPRGNVITRAVGAEDAGFALDEVSGTLQAGDRLLLCSDGLNKVLPDPELAGLLAAPDPAKALIAAALARHATDNVTAVAVRILP